MNYTEAEKLLRDNKYLEDKEIDGKELTLLIIPVANSGMNEVLRAIRRLDSLESVYAKYDNFDVIVFYDLDDFHLTGVLQFDNLLNILKRG